MKREIKFRAWNEGKMVDLLAITPLALDANMNTQLALKGMSGLFLPFGGGIELMQFTGLHDKNGKEIYEGDIVQWEDTVDDGYGCGYLTKIQEEVIFGGGAYNPISTMPSKYFEVIGNVYENPELLKA